MRPEVGEGPVGIREPRGPGGTLRRSGSSEGQGAGSGLREEEATLSYRGSFQRRRQSGPPGPRPPATEPQIGRLVPVG